MYERVHSSEIHLDPQLTPKYDQEFAHRLADTLQGKMPVYFAAIPTSMCVPFDLDYRPDLHPAGAQAIAQFAQHARQGDHALIIVYQRGYWFVISDDYIPCFAALTGLPDYLPCFVMGSRIIRSCATSRGQLNRHLSRKRSAWRQARAISRRRFQTPSSLSRFRSTPALNPGARPIPLWE